MYYSKKSKFIKEQEQEASFVLIVLNKFIQGIKMNEIVNKSLLGGDKFMPEIHLRQRGFTYSAFGPFTKNKEKNLKI